jgi:hypothetical protein
MRHEKRPALAATSSPGAVILERNTQSHSTKPRDVPLDDVLLLDGRKWPLLPEGEYQVVYTHHEAAVLFNTAKVFLHFRIAESGPYLNKRLYGAYRAAELIGRPGKNGRFKLKHRSELYLTLCCLYQAIKLRSDRISLHDLKRLVLRVTVRTVTKDYKQRLLPESLHYSVVDPIQGIEVGAVT